MNYIAFDFDGTIADSNFAICEAMERACIRNGADYVGDKEFTKYIGQDLDICIQKATTLILTDEQIAGVARSYRETFKYELVHAFEGMKEVLGECVANGDRLAIATSRRSHSLNLLLEENDLAQYFEFSVCGDQVEFPKPHIGMLQEIAKRFGCETKDLTYVGDTIWDVQMALDAGADIIGVTWGSHDEDKLRDAGAVEIFDTPEDLQKHFVTKVFTN